MAVLEQASLAGSQVSPARRRRGLGGTFGLVIQFSRSHDLG